MGRPVVVHLYTMVISKSIRRAITAAVLLPILNAASAETIHYKAVSREVIETRLKAYGGSNPQRELTLKQMFGEAGCGGDDLLEQPVKGSKSPNVICRLPGTSDKVIIIGAHYDHVSEGDGVVDNWSGASLLPSLFEAIKVSPRRHTYIFIGFTDEERGGVGSHFYVRQLTKEQVAATGAMVNMDTLGLAPSEVWASHSDKRLTAAFAFIANLLKLPVSAVDVEQVGSSDGEQFAERKIPRITIHSLTQENWNAHILHTSKDTISAMHLDEYFKTYQLLAAYITYLDQFLDASGEMAESAHH
jgi:hypothetical protein